MNRVINRAKSLMVLALVLAAGMVFFLFEYAINADNWVRFPGSPHLYGNSGLGAGVVTDRNGTVLMDTTQGITFSEDQTLRASMVHWLGDRQGNIPAPMLSHYAQELFHYNIFDGVYTYDDTPGSIRLTVSAQAQTAAVKALGDYKGTVAVYNYKTGEILCAVSTPAFDPDNVPDIGGDTDGTWEGAYVNRFLKSTYTPGSIFKIVTAAAALETIADIQQQTFVCNGVMEYGVDKVTCMRAHGELSFQEAFMRSCNCAFAQIAGQLGGETLQRYSAQFGITEGLRFDGVNTVPGNVEAQNTADVLVAWSAIGQHKDLINPCQFLSFVGAVAAGGNGVMPYMVSSVSGGQWQSHNGEAISSGRILSTEAAAALQAMMRNNVVNSYGEEEFHGLTVCAKSGTAEVGGEKKPNAMFTGFVTDEAYPFAFLVAVEDAGFGKQVCIPILSQVLKACMDSVGA